MEKIIFRKVENKCNHIKGKINILLVDKDYQGKGVGKLLVDRFIEYNKKNDSKNIYLYTNDISNYTFYDKIGFEKMFTINDELNSYICQKNIKGYVYAKTF